MDDTRWKTGARAPRLAAGCLREKRNRVLTHTGSATTAAWQLVDTTQKRNAGDDGQQLRQQKPKMHNRVSQTRRAPRAGDEQRSTVGRARDARCGRGDGRQEESSSHARRKVNELNWQVLEMTQKSVAADDGQELCQKTKEAHRPTDAARAARRRRGPLDGGQGPRCASRTWRRPPRAATAV